MRLIPYSLAQLAAREAVVDALVSLFVATDARDWDGVRSFLAPEVHFDMTSLAGGEPQTLSGEAVVATWEAGLRPIEAVHHQVGNFQVRVDGGDATASCYGIAYHFRKHPSGRNTRAFVGTYDLRLSDADGRWRVTSFRFACKFVDGNAALDRDA